MVNDSQIVDKINKLSRLIERGKGPTCAFLGRDAAREFFGRVVCCGGGVRLLKGEGGATAWCLVCEMEIPWK